MSKSATPDERWLDVPGWEGLYGVSDLGAVRSYPRRTVTGIHGGKTLKPILLGRPPYLYKAAVLCRPGMRYQVKVHKLVMLAFGPPQPPGQEIRHKNGDALDCRYGNLEWGTHVQNGQDMIDHGHANGPGDGSAHPRAKLTEELVIQLRAEYALGGVTERVLAERSGVNVSTLHRMLTRRTWDHV